MAAIAARPTPVCSSAWASWLASPTSPADKAPYCQLHALELKRKGMKPSEEQLLWMESVRALGGEAEWADLVELALRFC